MNRVVVTGMSANTPMGLDWSSFRDNVAAGATGVAYMPEWDCYEDLNTRLAAPITNFDAPEEWTRKQTRSMGRVALMATQSTEAALADAGLLGDPILQSGSVGVSYGSSTGSTDAVMDFGNMLMNKNLEGINATTYIRMMSHTTPVNIGVFFGLQGRVVTTSSACTSGSQGIGFAYELIKYGKQKIMVAGGAEELCPTEAAVFDTLYATSTKNDAPNTTPSPFDRDRDGLVIGEGSATLILEEREHALQRGAKIYAEVAGFGSNSDGGHVTQPNSNTMAIAMGLALEDAQLSGDAIGYVNAHGSATQRGDIAESHATREIFGARPVPIATLKGHIGHTLGACGSIEAWASINMMNTDWYAQTNNLSTPDPECAELDYIQSAPRDFSSDYVMSNNFAFGGINTSLIFARVN